MLTYFLLKTIFFKTEKLSEKEGIVLHFYKSLQWKTTGFS